MKILFLDIDETLLDYDKKLPKVNAEAIQRTIAKGNKVVVSSGRPLQAMLPIITSLGLNEDGCYAIAYNGAQIYDCGAQKSLVRETLTMEQVSYAFAAARKAGIHIQTYNKEDTVLVSAYDEETQQYCTRLHMPHLVQENLPQSLTDEPVKCLFIELHDRAKLEAFKDSLLENGKGEVNAFFSNQWYLEYVKAGVSKGTAVRWFCNYMNVPIENAISAGDSENDLSMIEAAGIGCAVANASEKCKEKADYITERDCANGAVAEIIEKFML